MIGEFNYFVETIKGAVTRMKNLFKKLSFDKLSVKGEILFLASFFTLLILIIFGLFLTFTYSDILYQNARRSIAHANADVLNYLDNYFTNIDGILSALAQNKDVLNAYHNDLSKTKALEHYELISKANPSIDFLFSGYENSLLLINDYTPPEDYDPRIRPWYTNARDQMSEFTTTQPYQEANSKEWVFAASKALINEKGDFVGVISTEFNNKTISNLLELNHMFDTQRSFILDQTGTILCHLDESFIGFNMVDMIGMLEEDVDFFEYEYDDSVSWAYYEKMPLTGWTIVTAIDQREVRQPIRRTQTVNSILTLLLALILGTILYVIFYKRLASPIKELQENVNLIMRGKDPQKQAYRYSNYELTQIAKRIEQLTESSLNKKKNELSVIVEASNDAIVFIDEQQQITNFNSNLLQFWGLQKADLNGSNASHLFNLMAERLAEIGDYPDKMQVLLTSGESVKFTVTLKNGSVYEVYSSPVVQNGILSGRLFTYHDMTDQKALEENIRKAKEAAEEASRAKSEFLANMSHEIRTPLSGVIGYTELLKNTSLDEKQYQYVMNAHKSAQALFEIINDILDFSKIEAGHMDMEYILTDIIQLTQDSVDVLTYNTDKKNLTIATQVQPEIPRFAKTDPMRLKQVLVNLISNAVKFTEKGMITVEVHFEEIDDQMGRYLFQVKDTGIGIDQDQQKKLFRAFSQADSSTTRKFGGTGLGLVISNYMVEKMGGQITFESEKGKGSTFQFTISTEYAYEMHESDHTKPIISKQIPLEEISPTIMIAEDMRINMMLVESILTDMIPNVEVIKASDGHQALIKTKEKAPDLILMDIQMPVMNGLEASREIRKFNTQIPIIALTAGVVKEEIDKCYEAGMNGFLAKPIDNSKLYKTLKEHLGNNNNKSKKGR